MLDRSEASSYRGCASANACGSDEDDDDDDDDGGDEDDVASTLPQPRHIMAIRR